ncbi:hypothetical protein BN2476_90022 [Paraburkholderia piptadeniae]|uniref:Uncharacterized protein n=1 Tax=Paraburkholderia piptadeniae TaxID=1701573 RepID=A0A1N7RMK6_9BURK|nr:hypothetical protein BN2476_90022 [Paraburkholderia piptadeniae]
MVHHNAGIDASNIEIECIVLQLQPRSKDIFRAFSEPVKHCRTHQELVDLARSSLNGSEVIFPSLFQSPSRPAYCARD